MSYILTFVIETTDDLEAEIIAGEIKKSTEECVSILGVERAEE